MRSRQQCQRQQAAYEFEGDRRGIHLIIGTTIHGNDSSRIPFDRNPYKPIEGSLGELRRQSRNQWTPKPTGTRPRSPHGHLARLSHLHQSGLDPTRSELSAYKCPRLYATRAPAHFNNGSNGTGAWRLAQSKPIRPFQPFAGPVRRAPLFVTNGNLPACMK